MNVFLSVNWTLQCNWKVWKDNRATYFSRCIQWCFNNLLVTMSLLQSKLNWSAFSDQKCSIFIQVHNIVRNDQVCMNRYNSLNKITYWVSWINSPSLNYSLKEMHMYKNLNYVHVIWLFKERRNRFFSTSYLPSYLTFQSNFYFCSNNSYGLYNGINNVLNCFFSNKYDENQQHILIFVYVYGIWNVYFIINN